MPVEIVSTAVINRAVLARQRLLKRSSSPIPRVLEAVGGLQTQYAPSGYVGLWSRMRLETRSALTRALQRRTSLQGTLMRATIHMVSASDYPAMAAGVRDARRAWWLRTTRPTDLDVSDLPRVAELVRRELASGPRPRAELIEAVTSAGFPETAWAGVGFWVDLIRVPPSGTWERRRADLYGLAEHAVDLGTVDRAGGLELLLRRYLGAFGPAPIGAAANWAGVPTGTLEEAAERLTLRHLRDADGTELLDLPRAPLPDPDHPAPPRFLPTWDAVLLVHARRSGILPEEYRPLVFHTRNPQSVPTFVIDGRVAGSWKYGEGRIVVSPYEPIPTRFADDLEAERRALERFHLEAGD